MTNKYCHAAAQARRMQTAPPRAPTCRASWDHFGGRLPDTNPAAVRLPQQPQPSAAEKASRWLDTQPPPPDEPDLARKAAEGPWPREIWVGVVCTWCIFSSIAHATWLHIVAGRWLGP